MIDHAIAPVWEAQPRLADLRLRGAVDLLPRGVRVDHADPLRPADPRRVRHRAARRGVRLPQGRASAPATGATSAPPSPCRRSSCRTAWARSSAASPPGRVPAGWGGRRPVEQLGQPHLDPHRRARRVPERLPRRRSSSSGTRGGCRTTTMVAYFRRRAVGGRGRGRRRDLVGLFVLADDAPYVFDGLTSRALPVVILSVLCGAGALFLLLRRARRGAPARRRRRGGRRHRAWGVAQWDYLLPTTLTVSAGSRTGRHHHGGARRHRLSRSPCSSPSSACSTSSTRRRCSPRRASPSRRRRAL